MTSLLIDGDELHVDDVPGPDGSPVVVWGHGFLLSAAFYTDVVRRLPGYRHVVLDLRGHGRSAGASDDASLTRMAGDTWKILQALGVRRFFYVGHSMGNAVGVRLTAAHPEAVLGGVSVAGIPVSGKLDEAREGVAGLVDIAGDAEALASALSGLYVHEQPQSLAVRSAGRAASLVHGDVISEVVNRQFFLRDAERLLPGLTQPWLFLVPTADAAEPADYQASQAALLHDARIVTLDGEGHMVPQERPELVARHVGAFLDEVSRAR